VPFQAEAEVEEEEEEEDTTMIINNKKIEFKNFIINYFLIMLNENIIKEFQRLIAFKKSEKEEFIKIKDTKNITAYNFRLKQLNSVLIILKKYPDKITLKNYQELKDIDGIGANTIQRIKEILESGKLAELNDFEDLSIEKEKIIEELEEVIGIGRVMATEFYNEGIKSVKILKQKIKKKEFVVNEKIELGLKYYGVYKKNIPRDEIDEINKLIKKAISKMNSHYKLDKESKYIFQICGSYRREKPTSGDIDVLISKLDLKDDTDDNINHLERVINTLKNDLKENDDKPLLIDDITDKNYETKYMGFAKYKKNPVRRIDIRFVSYESYYSALLYFTGSAELNKKMRTIAKKFKLKLSEYGLFKEDGTKIKINSEEDFFQKLDLPFIEPKYR
jgi:DNA polymerase/3'-5' exonuclease PolX